MHHIFLIIRQFSHVLQLSQSTLYDLLHLLLGNYTLILGSCDANNFQSGFLVLFVAQAHKGPRFAVEALDGFSSFADDQCNQTQWNFDIYLIRPINRSAVRHQMAFKLVVRGYLCFLLFRRLFLRYIIHLLRKR